LVVKIEGKLRGKNDKGEQLISLKGLRDLGQDSIDNVNDTVLDSNVTTEHAGTGLVVRDEEIAILVCECQLSVGSSVRVGGFGELGRVQDVAVDDLVSEQVIR
jgi:hypothetical protein